MNAMPLAWQKASTSLAFARELRAHDNLAARVKGGYRPVGERWMLFVVLVGISDPGRSHRVLLAEVVGDLAGVDGT